MTSVSGDILTIDTNETLDSLFNAAWNSPSGDTGIYFDRFTSFTDGLTFYKRKGIRITITGASAQLTIPPKNFLYDDANVAKYAFLVDNGGTLTLGEKVNNISNIEPCGIFNNIDYGRYSEKDAFIRVDGSSFLNCYNAFIYCNAPIAIYNDVVFDYRNLSIKLLSESEFRYRCDQTTSNSYGLRITGILTLIGTSPLPGLTFENTNTAAIIIASASSSTIDYIFPNYNSIGIGGEDVRIKGGVTVVFIDPLKPVDEFDLNSVGGGIIQFKFSLTWKVTDVNNNPINSRFYLIDTDNGLRVSSTTAKNDYTSDLIINQTSNDNHVLELLTAVFSTTNNDDPPLDYRVPYNGCIYSYGYELSAVLNVDPDRPNTALVRLKNYPVSESDPNLVAAYPITLDHELESIVLNDDISIDQLEDYIRYDKSLSTGIDKPDYLSFVISKSGINYLCKYSINTQTYTLSGDSSLVLNLPEKVFSGNSTLQVIDLNGATVNFTINNIIPNSEVRIYRTSDDTELDGIESSGTSFTYTYNYTEDVDVKVVILNVGYIYLTFLTTLSSSPQVYRAEQKIDRVFFNP